MEGEVVKTGMEAIITAMADVVTVMGKVFTVITGNPYLMFLLAASLVGVGIGIFQAVKSAAR